MIGRQARRRCSIACWPARRAARALCWSCTATLASARPCFSNTQSKQPRVSASFGPQASRERQTSITLHCRFSARQSSISPRDFPARSVRRSMSLSASSAGRAPNPLLVGLATLGLMWEAADQQPLMFVVDDAHWLDEASATALAFVARRLLAEPIAMIFATRDVGSDLRRFPSLHVGPLGSRDALALLESALPARLDQSVLERMVAETAGNPLALVELPRGLTNDQLAGGFGLPAALPLSARIEESFQRRLAALPRDAQRLLLVAAAEPLGDPALLWNAARRLGISENAAQTLESEGLLTLDGAVTFRHPLVRSAVYGSADPNERREVHRVLADATDPEVAPDRRAWHRSQATLMPDEEVATDLECSATAAQARGGFAAAAAFLERSAASDHGSGTSIRPSTSGCRGRSALREL